MTVETAVALAGFVTVLALALGAISAAVDQLRCTDAAREAARLTARGDSDGAAAAARRIAPRGATVDISTEGEEIHVIVHAAPVAGLVPGLRVRAEAFAIGEPTPGSPP
ncbi:TadE family type IV pilus minor pilin [Actinophytocola xanthii]|uniref:TadE family type IV pilus minor pilin n=1 Tax=Actinophytocola xanthii TaxID=1912961 RepID=UPI001E2F5F9C|nr:TadE family type IV pilus minor pilin [Actinophytocola xanthii]